MESQIPNQILYKIQEAQETTLLATVNEQDTGDLNEINGQPHRWVASKGAGTNSDVLSLEDFVQMRLSFLKANVPENGWIAIVDPMSEATLNYLAQKHVFDQRPQFNDILEGGFAQNHKFLYNIMGFDTYVSNRLPTVTETIDGTSITNGIVNIFASVGDDMVTPFMTAQRQPARVEGERNKDFQCDEYVATARWGNGLQRKDSLGAVITSSEHYA